MSHRLNVLVLGASSGLGAACARAFAGEGHAVYGVHMDRARAMEAVDALVEELRREAADVAFFNGNAASDRVRQEVLRALSQRLQPSDGRVDVLVHSLAFGSMAPLVSKEGPSAGRRHIEMTLDVMASSLAYWARDLVDMDLLASGGRVFALTSAGSRRAWPSYGPVSAAKAALEAIIRQLALELAPLGVTANAIQPGVTDTPALRRIPGHEALVEAARARNPGGRLTRPEDVGRCLVELSRPGTAWMTGNCIRVDGGEDIAG